MQPSTSFAEASGSAKAGLVAEGRERPAIVVGVDGIIVDAPDQHFPVREISLSCPGKPRRRLVTVGDHVVPEPRARHDERLPLAPEQQDGVEVEPLAHLAERIRVGLVGRLRAGVEKGMGQLSEQSLEIQPRGHVVQGVAPFVDRRRQREVRQRGREDEELDADQRLAGREREERAVAVRGRDDDESVVIRTVTLAPIVPNRTAAQAMNGSRKARGTRTAPGMNVYLASANGMANQVLSNPAPSAVHSSMRRGGGHGSSEVR